jgi:hypothetical protein
MSRAVVHADATAGLVAVELVRPERSAGMKVSSVEKKLKEKVFAPGVNREEVYGAEATLGLPLEEFIAVSIAGLQQVVPEIGLKGDAGVRRPVNCGSQVDSWWAKGCETSVRGDSIRSTMLTCRLRRSREHITERHEST